MLPRVAHAAAASAKLLQSCPTLCNPIDGSPPSSPSLGFSREEHWSGLPFPFPMHESEKWKWSRSAVSDSQRPHGLQPTRLLRPWDFPGKSTGVGCHYLLREWLIQGLKRSYERQTPVHQERTNLTCNLHSKPLSCALGQIQILPETTCLLTSFIDSCFIPFFNAFQ